MDDVIAAAVEPAGVVSLLPYLIEVVLKSTIVLVATGLVAVMLHKRSATARHFAWTIGIAGILILPIAMPFLPVWGLLPSNWELIDVPHEQSAMLSDEPEFAANDADDAAASQLLDKNRDGKSFARGSKSSRSMKPGRHSELPPAASLDVRPGAAAQAALPTEMPEAIDSVASTSGSHASWEWLTQAVLLIWGSGTAVLLLRIFIGQAALWRTSRSFRRIRDGHLYEQMMGVWDELGFKHRIRLYVSPGPTMPMAWGLMGSNVLLPTTANTWSLPHLRSVLLHELAHIGRRDCLTQLLAQVATAVHWFNPLVWLASHQMRIERELACDDRALVAGTVAIDYARHLIDVTMLSRPSRFVSVAAVGIAKQSQLESRIRALLDRKPRRRPISTHSAGLLTACLFASIVALGAVGKTTAEASNTTIASAADEAQLSTGDVLSESSVLPDAVANVRPLVSKALRGFVLSIDWSRDGKLIAFGEAGNIRIYDAATLKLQKVLVGHTSAIRSVAFSPNGRHVASCGTDGSVRIWNFDGSPDRVFLDHHSDVNCVAWSPDSKHIASAGNDGTVRIFHIDGEVGPVYRNHVVRVRSVAWSPDGTTLASGDDNHLLHVWKGDGTTLRVLEGHRGAVSAIDWSPDGSRIASVCHGVIDHFDSSKTIAWLCIWQADGTAVATQSLRGGELRDVSWSADGRYLATAGDEGSIQIWRPDGTLIRAVAKAADGVSAIAWNPSGDKIVLASRSLVHVLTFDGSPHQELNQERRFVQSVAWHPDGSQIVVGCEDGTVRSFGADGSIGWVRSLGKRLVSAVAWSPDGSRIAAVGGDRKVAIFDQHGYSGPVQTIPDSMPISVAWSPDGSQLAAGCFNGDLYLMSPETSVNRIVRAHARMVHSVAWSPDGQLLATGGWDGTMRLWRADGSAERTYTDTGGNVDEVAWSPDGKRIASAQAAGVRIRDLDGSNLSVLPSEGDVIDMRWNPQGTRIAGATWDSIVQQWSPDGTRGPLFKLHAAPVAALDWSHDGRLLATGSYDSTLRVCDANTGKPMWTAYLFGDGRTLTFDAMQRLLNGDRAILESEFEQIDANQNQTRIAELGTRN